MVECLATGLRAELRFKPWKERRVKGEVARLSGEGACVTVPEGSSQKRLGRNREQDDMHAGMFEGLFASVAVVIGEVGWGCPGRREWLTAPRPPRG